MLIFGVPFLGAKLGAARNYKVAPESQRQRWRLGPWDLKRSLALNLIMTRDGTGMMVRAVRGIKWPYLILLYFILAITG